MQLLRWIWRQLAPCKFAACALYTVFGILDTVLSNAAFGLGVPEGNPILAWTVRNHLFSPAKFALTAYITWLIWTAYERGPHAPKWVWGVNGMMLLLYIWHIIGISMMA